ncbi:PBSX family phage terminase large subunit [Xanthomonas sacchari]
MTTVRIELPPKLVPVFAGEADFRGAYGGRGSAKTRSFAKMAAVRALMWAQEGRRGVVVCGREFMNSLAESSMAEVKAAIHSEPWLAEHFDVGEEYIRTADRKVEFVFIGLRHNLDSIKSKARILLLWVDEAENVSETAWEKAIPTVREEGSEVWVTWNPEREASATHKRFREDPPALSKIVELNWRDNPFFPASLNRKRLEDKEKRPDSYDHIWEGGMKTAISGAYYAAALALAKEEGRISRVAADPLMTLRAYWDIGGTGAKADACAIWIVQFIGRSIPVVRYYEAVGQPLATHVDWLRRNGFDRAACVLPHDGAANDKVYAVSYESELRNAGFEVRVIPNMGVGAAMTRIEAARRVLPSVWFNNALVRDAREGVEGKEMDATGAGRAALGWYHEKRDEKRNIGFGPNHDWASHGADAFGMMAVDYLSTDHTKVADTSGLMDYPTDY